MQYFYRVYVKSAEQLLKMDGKTQIVNAPCSLNVAFLDPLVASLNGRKEG
jgi:hypothetical protein